MKWLLHSNFESEVLSGAHCLTPFNESITEFSLLFREIFSSTILVQTSAKYIASSEKTIGNGLLTRKRHVY